MNTQTAHAIIKSMDLLAKMAIIVPEQQERYLALNADIRKMVEEGRDPTDEEWAEIDAETDALIEAL